jgi:hypothetical protein
MHYREQNINAGYPSGRPPMEHASRSVPSDAYNASSQGGYYDADGQYCPPGLVR